MADPIKFARGERFSEVLAASILKREPKGITFALSAAASELLEDKARELRFKEPLLTFTEKMTKVSQAYPACTTIMFRAFKEGFADPETVQADYQAEE